MRPPVVAITAKVACLSREKLRRSRGPRLHGARQNLRICQPCARIFSVGGTLTDGIKDSSSEVGTSVSGNPARFVPKLPASRPGRYKRLRRAGKIRHPSAPDGPDGQQCHCQAQRRLGLRSSTRPASPSPPASTSSSALRRPTIRGKYRYTSAKLIILFIPISALVRLRSAGFPALCELIIIMTY
jgi:hypothetical protein